MLIRTNTQSPTRFVARPMAQPPTPSQELSADSVTLSSSERRRSAISEIPAFVVVGGISLAGAALGVYAGSATGVLAGLAGAVTGLSAGASIGAQTPSQRITTGAVVGALAGGIASASFGGTTVAVVMGVAGATLPYGTAMGLANLLGY